MIEIKDKKDCCGCHACYSACPKQCVTMMEDEEGYLYPKVDTSLCIDCGLCEKVCPILQYKQPETKTQKAFVVQHRDEEVLAQSTSGGAYTAIAKWILGKGGVVFGAHLNSQFEAEHCYVERYEDLWQFRNSKYVQSRIGDTYKQVRDFLKEERIVLYSGTPCQLEGLFQFLHNKQYDNLYTVDVVCRAVPSPLVLRKYLEVQKGLLATDLKDVKFRDKYHGYKYSSMSLFGKNGKDYHEGIDTDVYLRSFFSGTNIRLSCPDCKFRNRYRRTDFTIWDCFTIDEFSSELDNDKGATRILCQSDRAVDILNELTSEMKIMEVDSEKAVRGVKELVSGPSLHPQREAFFRDLNAMPASEVFQKYFPITLRHRLEKQARLWSNRLGIYKMMKKAFKLVHGKGEVKR